MKRPRIRKRSLFMLMLLLVGGAIINVAVAEICRYPLRVRRDAGVQSATLQSASHMPCSVGDWVFLELSQSGWPRATVDGLDGFHGIWPGFAINTVFYAAICWLLFAAPFAVRRRRRIKRGLCPACAYPVGTSDLCTECGAPVKVLPGG